MNENISGKLTLTDVPRGPGREAIIDLLTRSRKGVSRERVTEMLGTLPLVLSRSISGDAASRLVAELERLGAKLHFAPHGTVEPSVEARQTRHEEMDRSALGEALLAAFSNETIQFPVSSSYRVGLFLVFVAMVLLSFTYLALIGGIVYLMVWHATANLDLLTSAHSLRSALGAYGGPLFLGAVLILFLIKPILARRAGPDRFYEIFPGDEPLLFAFIQRVCKAVGAPMPSSVHLDTQVNASAGFGSGFRSLFARDLVLTVGLPLARGLDVREFAGVLAHEFGHFAQSSGMRLSYLIRSLNHWFARVVYEEDAYDVRLRVLSRSLGYQGLFLYVIRFFIWVVKRFLFVLMKVGHFISCFMLRQMEFDADRYEAALVGVDAFESTMDKLGHLSVAHARALDEGNRLWEDGHLADDLPELVQIQHERMEEHTKREIRRDRVAKRTRSFDTHPADSDRVASARLVARPSVFQWPPPDGTERLSATYPQGSIPSFMREGSPPSATVLFRDFQTLAKKVTREHYRQVLGRVPDPKSLVSVGALLRTQDREKQYSEAVERFFLGAFNPWIPLGIEALKLAAPTDISEAGRELRDLRDHMRSQSESQRELVRKWADLMERSAQAAGALALLDAGFGIDPEAFQVPGGTIGEVTNAIKAYADSEKSLLREAGAFAALARDRMILGLELLQAVPSRQWDEETGRMRDRAEVYLQAMDAMEFQFPLCRKLQSDFRALAALTRMIPKHEDSEALRVMVGERMEAVMEDLRALRERLSRNPYPLEHLRSDLTLGHFLVDGDPEGRGLGDLLAMSETVLDRFPRTYSRLAARLAWLAERAERAHGLEPLA